MAELISIDITSLACWIAVHDAPCTCGTHLKEYGYVFHTDILLCTQDKKELSETGRYFSNLWDVVNSADWLNEIPETGGGPGQSSEFVRNMNLKRVENGTHNWLGGKHQKAVNKNRINRKIF